jgi:hypothetical protein
MKSDFTCADDDNFHNNGPLITGQKTGGDTYFLLRKENLKNRLAEKGNATFGDTIGNLRCQTLMNAQVGNNRIGIEAPAMVALKNWIRKKAQ